MKLFSIVLLLLFVFSHAPLTAGSGKKYGKGVTVKERTKISDILANPQKYDGKKVAVEGPIIDVCKKRGCWIKIGSDKEFESLRFKVEDGVIVFPMKAKGKKVVAEGTVSVDVVSVEDQIAQGKHHAEEQGTAFDPKSITGPKTIVQIMGLGALIK